MAQAGMLVKAAPTNKEIIEHAKFAVKTYNEENSKDLKFVKVLEKKMQEQAVSGTMYYIKLEATDGGVKGKYDADVMVYSKDSKELKDFQKCA